MEKLLEVNISLLQWVSLFCVILAICMFCSKNYKVNQRKILLVSLILVAVITMADSYTWVFRNDISVSAYFVSRIATFVVFFTGNFIVIAYHAYLSNLIFDGKIPSENERGYLRFNSVFVIMTLGVVTTFINLKSGAFYSISAENTLVRGPLYIVTMIIPAIGLLIDLSLLVEFRKVLDKGSAITSSLFIILPAIAAVIEYNYPDLSLITLSVGFASVVLFMHSIIEQNNLSGKAAMTDLHTGTLNSFGLAKRIDRLSGSDDILNYNLYVFSIERFSLVVRRFGADKSDDVIDSYLSYLIGHIDSNETIAHMSGECFGALIKKENEEYFLKMLERVNVKVRSSEIVDNVNISAVCGVYEFKGVVQNGREAIANASLALTNAIRTNMDNVCIFTPEMKAEYVEALKLEENIIDALEREEFIPYYQPRVDVRTGKICSAEALARWINGPEIYNPSKFLPIMEEGRLICEFDFYMLERVCRDIESWISYGITPPVISVNFSRKNLSDRDLAEHIDRVVRSHNIPRKLIEIEITETNTDEFSMFDLNSFVNRLHICGYKVALDHFGMGSSALNLLSEIDFDVIKIDKSLVERPYERHRMILGDVISMAKRIGIEVIAEGVEREDQLDALKLLGCDFAQGFLFDRPMNSSLFEKRIKDMEFEYKNTGVC